MKDRKTFHEELCQVLGSRNCYYQPPSSKQLKYPCIIYSLNRHEKIAAENKPYLLYQSYDIIVIDKDPDSVIPFLLLDKFPTCRYDRTYESDNLNHFSLTITI